MSEARLEPHLGATVHKNLAAALLAVQAESPDLQKTAINPHFGNRYVSLDSLMGQIGPLLNKHGIVLLQFPTNLDGVPALRTRLVHAASGESIEDVMPLLLDKENSQAQGSALTYARRYSLMSILGLVADEDDDGNSAARRSGDGRVADPHGLQASRADYVPSVSLDEALTDPGSVVLHFSKNKGKKLADLSERQLAWYASEWEPKPEYATDQDWTLKAAAQQLAGVPVSTAPAVDDDIPF